jgi:hypothetical protein
LRRRKFCCSSTAWSCAGARTTTCVARRGRPTRRPCAVATRCAHSQRSQAREPRAEPPALPHQASLNTALRARACDTPAAGAERLTPHVTVEVLPGSAVRSRVLRAQHAEDDAAAPAQHAAELSAYDTFALEFAAEPAAPPWALRNDDMQRASSGVVAHESAPPGMQQQQQAALNVALELQDRLTAMSAVMRRLEARMHALEADGRATPAAAPAEQPWPPQRSVSVAAPYVAAAAAPAIARTDAEDLRAFIDGVVGRFEETRMLLASTRSGGD